MTMQDGRRRAPTLAQAMITILAGIGIGWWSNTPAGGNLLVAVTGTAVASVTVLVGTAYTILGIIRRLQLRGS